MELLTSGERVRHFRKLLGISQKQLADNKVSSNLISLIERNKIPLSTVTASILVDNINRFSVEQGFELNLSIRDLLMPREEYLKIQCEEKIDRAKEIGNKECEEAIELCNKHDFMDVLVKVEEKKADEFFEYKDYKNAAKHYKNYIESNRDKANINVYTNSVYRLALCCYNMEQYGVALKYMNEAYELMVENDYKEQIGNALYELALINLKIRNLDLVEEYINKLLNLSDCEEELKNKAVFLKGNLYLERAQYYDALKVYRSLVGKEMKDIDMLYCNISNALDKVVTN